MYEHLMDGFSHQDKCPIEFSKSGHLSFKEQVLAPSLIQRFNVDPSKMSTLVHNIIKRLHSTWQLGDMEIVHVCPSSFGEPLSQDIILATWRQNPISTSLPCTSTSCLVFGLSTYCPLHRIHLAKDMNGDNFCNIVATIRLITNCTPKRAYVNINTGAQSINTESLFKQNSWGQRRQRQQNNTYFYK